MTNQALTIRDGTSEALVLPADVVARATDQSNVLMKVVQSQGKAWVSNISGNRYLKFEAWQTIGRFNNATPVTEWTREIREGGEFLGYEARVNVVDVHTREIISSAEAMCGMDEHVTRGQSGVLAKRNAARSMAQTRAASKALRMAYSFVAVLAGFEATPAEEMPRDAQPAQRPSQAPSRASQPQPPAQRPRRESVADARVRLMHRAIAELGYDSEEAVLGYLGEEADLTTHEGLSKAWGELVAAAHGGGSGLPD